MIANLFEVRETSRRGKGLFATGRIPRGTLIDHYCDRCKVVCTRQDLEVMSPGEQDKVLEHTFATESGDVVLDCSIGRYMNHSCNANVLEHEGGFDIAVRDILPGEEVTCDYRQFYDPCEGFTCHCGQATCWGHVHCREPHPEALELEWSTKLEAASRAIKLPFEFTSGIGSNAVSVETWQKNGSGYWQPIGIHVSEELITNISYWLNLRDSVPIVYPHPDPASDVTAMAQWGTGKVSQKPTKVLSVTDRRGHPPAEEFCSSQGIGGA